LCRHLLLHTGRGLRLLLLNMLAVLQDGGLEKLDELHVRW